ncbi:MAG: gamma-glutamylcyclotransferase [Chitinophagaceae bacterium]|nr:MAG: gamma-glutamylcyclotransferase [Chitinophagaceae bacterium]
MQASNHYLFVYGSLLSGFKTEAYQYLSKYFEYVGEGYIDATMYDMGKYPVVTLEHTGHKVKGELYAIKSSSEFSYIIGQLDDYEGLFPEQNEQVFFKRNKVEALINGTTYTAWVYEYIGNVSDKPIYPAGDSISFFNDKSQG